MKIFVVLAVLVAAAFAAPQVQILQQPQVQPVQQQAAASAPSPPATFFFTPFSGVPPVFSVGQSSFPLLPQSAALQAAPATTPAPAPPAQSAALVQAQDASINAINGQSAISATGPLLPAELARAYTESNLRLAQAYKEAEIQLAAANQKAAAEVLAQAIAGAAAASNPPVPAAQAPAPAPAPVQQAAFVQQQPAALVQSAAAPAPAVSPSVIPLGFPISIIPSLSSQIASRVNGRR